MAKVYIIWDNSRFSCAIVGSTHFRFPSPQVVFQMFLGQIFR